MARALNPLAGVIDASLLGAPVPQVALELPSELGAIETAVEYVTRRCESCGDDPRRFRFNFRVALTEALSNAMLYGNHRDPSKRVRIEVYVRNCSVIARVTDEGEGFDPRRIPDPTAKDNVTKSGGRGLFLMHNLLDEVHYNDRGNSVTLVLRRSPSSGLEGGAPA